jgi:hypothetical protein
MNIPSILIPSDNEMVERNISNISNISNKERIFPIAIDSEWSSSIYEIWMCNNKYILIMEDVLCRIKQLDASYDWALYNEDFSEKTISELKSEENVITNGMKMMKDMMNIIDMGSISNMIKFFGFFKDIFDLESEYFDRILSNTSSKSKYILKYLNK